MKFLIPIFPACAGFGPLLLCIGARSVGPLGMLSALLGGFMITAALYGVFALLARQTKEIESLKELYAQVSEPS
jgi:hypothetical protein